MQLPPGHDLESLINKRRIGGFQIGIVVLCAFIAMLDGFDTQAIAFVAPAILQEWHVAPSAFGPVFGAGLFGGLIGAMIFGMLSDRIGRKPSLLISVLLFSVGSLVTLLSTTVDSLSIVRFVTGIGLGGAVPCFISLTSEYAPGRLRTTVIAAMFCGYPIGAMIGGLASAKLITAFGWQSVFILGGVLPLAILPFLVVFLPESITFLALKKDYDGIRTILRRMGCEKEWNGVVRGVPHGETKAPLRSLFQDGRTSGTVLLWITLFLSLLLTYFLVNWIPLVAQREGHQLEVAVHAVSALNLGAVIGCLIIGKLADKFGPAAVISSAFAFGSLAIAAIGIAAGSSAALIAATFMTGLLSMGAQMCTVALCAAFYDTFSRATGIGWSMGVGRIGAIAGPVLGGVLLGAGMAPEQLFTAVATTSIGAAISSFAVGRILRRRAQDANQHSAPKVPGAVPSHNN